jgi:hypothetical protein
MQQVLRQIHAPQRVLVMVHVAMAFANVMLFGMDLIAVQVLFNSFPPLLFVLNLT